MAVTVETYASAVEAARALGRGEARYLGGGTLVMRAVNAGDQAIGRIVRTTDPALGEIRVGGETVTLGAGVTMAAVLAHPDLGFLAQVARAVGGPAIRNMGTVGGNLFAPPPYGDFAAALLALGARLRLAGQGGETAVEDFLRGRDRASGLVQAVEVPRPRDPRSFGFLKVSRVHPKGVSLLTIAAYLPREAGRMRNPRIAYGAMGPAPLRAATAERVLEGQALDTTSIARAAGAAAEGIEPPTDALASSWYRREVAGVHLRRLLERMERG